VAKISACIISFNEEKKIEACIESLLPVVDEVVVVDSLSSDKTVELAEKYTDKIFHQKFLGHVEQKNLAVSRAQHDWILSLDCDERLTPELQQSILAIKEQLEKHDAYRMARKTFYVYRWLNYCWYPDRKTRLFNKSSARWGGVNPHDRVETDGSDVVELAGDIEHYSFDSISAHLKTMDSFTEIGAREIIKKNKPVNIFTPLVHAAWTFFRLYILRRGFMDGFAGFVVSLLSFMHVFVKYSKVIFIRRQESGS
jgi:glycosyltransferase involved in cell wall biosynthesis